MNKLMTSADEYELVACEGDGCAQTITRRWMNQENWYTGLWPQDGRSPQAMCKECGDAWYARLPHAYRDLHMD
jgi:hypothetical protein